MIFHMHYLLLQTDFNKVQSNIGHQTSNQSKNYKKSMVYLKQFFIFILILFLSVQSCKINSNHHRMILNMKLINIFFQIIKFIIQKVFSFSDHSEHNQLQTNLQTYLYQTELFRFIIIRKCYLDIFNYIKPNTMKVKPKINDISKQSIQQLFKDYRPDKHLTDVLSSWGGYKGIFAFTKSDKENGISKYPNQTNQLIYQAKDFIHVNRKQFTSFIQNTLNDPLLKIIYILTLALFCIALGKGNQSFIYQSLGIFVLLTVLVLCASIFKFRYYHYLMTSKEVSNGSFASVIRKGKVSQIPIWQLRFGDVIQLSAGSNIFASGILIEGVDMIIQERQKVGNSGVYLKQTMKKQLLGAQSPNPFLISNSRVLAGHGKMITLVGDYIQQQNPTECSSNFDSSIKKAFQNTMVQFGTIFTLVFLMGVLVYSTSQITRLIISKSLPAFSIQVIMQILKELIALLSLFIISVSESSSLIVMSSLVFAISKLKQNNNLVRNFQAFQNLKSINRICIDEAVLENTNYKNNLKQLIYRLKQQNIGIVLLTEKERNDAISFGLQIGLATDEQLKKEQIVVKSSQFRQHYICTFENKNDADFKAGNQSMVQKFPDVRMVCEISSTQKLDVIWYLTEVCKQSVCIVGAENAEILSMAAVSMSLGIPSSSYNNLSSDIVILDYDMVQIRNTIQESRSIMQSINRFIQFKYQTCITLFVLQTAYYLLRTKLLFTAAQIVWVNIIIDVVSITISQFGFSQRRISTVTADSRNWQRIIIMSLYRLGILLYLMMTTSENSVNEALVFHVFTLTTIGSMLAKNIPSLQSFGKKLKNLVVVMFLVMVIQSLLINKVSWFIGCGGLKYPQQIKGLIVGCSVFPFSIVVDFVSMIVHRRK